MESIFWGDRIPVQKCRTQRVLYVLHIDKILMDAPTIIRWVIE